MRVDIGDIKEKAGLHKTVPVEVSVEPVELGGQLFHFDRPFKGQAEIWNAGDRLLVRAHLSGDSLVQCSRCLSPSTLPMDVAFEEEFIEGTEDAGAAADDDDESGLPEVRTISYYQGDEIDLSEPMRENVLLELPMKPLCSPDCEGLCPTCGANRNDAACDCADPEKPVDPRFAAIKDLFRKPDSTT